MRVKLRALIVVLAVTGTTVAASPSYAQGRNGVPSLCAAHDAADVTGDVRLAQISQARLKLAWQGLSESKIEQRLAADFGVVPVTKSVEPTIEPLTVKGDVTIARPSISRDTCSSRYLAFGSFRWNNKAWINDKPGSCPSSGCNIGPDDAFGLALSRNVTVTGYSFTTINSAGVSRNRGTPDDSNSAGVVYAEPDFMVYGSSVSGWIYDFDYGQIAYSFSGFSCGDDILAFTKYGHSWSSVSLNGVSVGPWSVGISWSNTTNAWNAASQPSAALVTCK